MYSWVKNYQRHGEEALKDNRGRNRSSEFLTEEERLKVRIKELEARNRHLEMENDFAKKVIRDSTTKSTLTLVINVELYQVFSELHEERHY